MSIVIKCKIYRYAIYACNGLILLDKDYNYIFSSDFTGQLIQHLYNLV